MTNVFHYVVDWKSLRGIREHVSIRVRGTEMYSRLKANVDDQHTPFNDNLTTENFKLAEDKQESTRNIDRVHRLIKGSKQKLTEYNCILGKELTNQKMMCYTDICFKCSLAGMFSAIAHGHCLTYSGHNSHDIEIPSL